MKKVLLPIALLLLASCASSTKSTEGTGGSDEAGMAAEVPWQSPAALTARCGQRLAYIKGLRDRVSAASSHTVDGVLKPYNELLWSLDEANSMAQLHANVHPEESVRKAGEKCEQQVKALVTEISLDRKLYDALNGVPEDGLDEQTKRFRSKMLMDLQLAGVDKDEATRKKLKELQEEMVKVGQEFSRNIREDVRSIEVDPADLAGLPEDFIKTHAPDAKGKVKLTTNYPDYIPVQNYVAKEDVRKKLVFEFLNRGYPKNEAVLGKLLKLRKEFASLLGYQSWADYKATDKMAKTAKAIEEFTEKVAKIGRPRMESDLKLLLARKKKDSPKAKTIEVWDRFFYVGKVRSEDYGFDSQKIRPYFEVRAVRDGILDLYGELFGVTFKQRTDVPVWHESVTAHDLLLDGKPIGRFYLDLHPREGKYGHAAMFPMVTGLENGPMPEASLVCNFPDPAKHQDGALMEHGQVVTFFHEFGHLIHHLLASSSKWYRLAGLNMEWDFVEVPSQLLEEWAWDADVLARFAKHYKTGEVVPKRMVEQMRASSDFGKGVHIMRQVFYTALSFYLHSTDPEKLDLSAFSRKLQQKYNPYPVMEGTHIFSGFGHLEGYGSNYYTYQWSLTLAKDMYTKFEEQGLLNKEVAAAYRDKVLKAGATKDAAKMVEDFLGRPSTLDAYQKWLEREPKKAN